MKLDNALGFYDLVGVIIPGLALVFGVAFLLPGFRPTPLAGSVGIGDFGVLVLLAYAVGHVVQGVGNLLESTVWFLHRGWPTDWVRTGVRPLLAEVQLDELRKTLWRRLSWSGPIDYTAIPRREWANVVRQMRCSVDAAGQGSRIESLNGIYGLLRGLASALVLLIGIAGCKGATGAQFWTMAAAAAIAIVRMRRFGLHYARELLVTFLGLPLAQSPTGVTGTYRAE